MNSIEFKGNFFMKNLNIKGRKIVSIYVRNNKFYNSVGLKDEITNDRLNNAPRNFTADVYKDIIEAYSHKFFFIKLGYKDQDKTLDQYNLENFYDLSNDSNILVNLSFFYKKFKVYNSRRKWIINIG